MQAYPEDARALLVELFHTALAAVHGRHCVARHLRIHRPAGPGAVIAIGKAACAMLSGAMEVLPHDVTAALVITPAGQTVDCPPDDDRIDVIHGNHPVPDTDSLAAGERLLEFIDAQPHDCRLLFLISGGASSLVEVPRNGIGLADLQAVNRWLLGSGLDIAQMNRIRTALSQIKGGKLARRLGGRHAVALLLSDVPGDDPAVIGSGLLQPAAASADLPAGLPPWLQRLLELPATPAAAERIEHHIVADNQAALVAIAGHARGRGLPAEICAPALAGDVGTAATRIRERLQTATPGVYVWGGETTVRLPEQPGTGGRNQQLALGLARGLRADDRIVVLAAGTDGRDGNSEAAGAIVDAETVRRGEAAGQQLDSCLQRADAGSFLAASGDLLYTGPTGTNVMDIVIAMKLPQAAP